MVMEKLEKYWYISGPMRGYAEFNFPAFDAAAKVLREQGYAVLSPAEMDREHGFDGNGLTGTTEELDAVDFCPATAIRRDLDVILAAECVGVIVLPNWEGSRGANVEVSLAQLLGKPVITYPDLTSIDPADDFERCSTGAVRSADLKDMRYDLISPIGLRRVAETCHEGALKYGDYNWEKGFPISSLLNHAISHCFKFLAGDTSEDHLAHGAWNLLAACHSQELWPELNCDLRGPGCKPPVKEAA